MEGLNNKVLQSFGVGGRYAGRLKGGFLIKSGNRFLFLKKVSCKPEDIIFQDKVKKYLYNNGFLNIDMYYESTGGKPYYNHNSELYVMTDYIQGEELDFSEGKVFLKLIQEVAAMHSIMEKAGLEGSVGENYLSQYRRSEKHLKDYKKQISKTVKMSDFDVLFYKNYDYYSAAAEEALAIMDENDYLSFYENSSELSHNLLKKENIYTDKDNIFITNFTKLEKGLFINDLSDLIHRYLKYNEHPSIGIKEILNAYEEIRNLKTEEIKLIYAMLRFPSNFCKICGQYYSKKRTWTPGAISVKAAEIISQQSRYDDFIKDLI